MTARKHRLARAHHWGAPNYQRTGVGLLVRQCAGITHSGGRCARSAEGPNGLCWLHDPNRAGERRRVASRAGRSRGTKEVLTLKGEIKNLIASVKDGSLDRNDAAVMIQGYRVLKDLIEVERRVREQEELEGRLAGLERALEATETARGA